MLPETLRANLQKACAALDLMLAVVTSSLGLAFAAVAAGFLAATRTGSWPSWVAVVGRRRGGRVGGLPERGAGGGHLRRAGAHRFDLYSGALLAQLGYTAPGSLEEERTLWRNVGQQLYRRSAADPQVLRRRYAGAPTRLDVTSAGAAEGGEQHGT